jgi:predicted ArsR family transcriptional regulator
LERVASGLAETYRPQLRGDSLDEKMQSVGALFEQRSVPIKVDRSGPLPVLTALACPYPDLAERDRGVCAMERMLLADLLGRDVVLTGCRLDGRGCCTFEVSPG